MGGCVFSTNYWLQRDQPVWMLKLRILCILSLVFFASISYCEINIKRIKLSCSGVDPRSIELAVLPDVIYNWVASPCSSFLCKSGSFPFTICVGLGNHSCHDKVLWYRCSKWLALLVVIFLMLSYVFTFSRFLTLTSHSEHNYNRLWTIKLLLTKY